MPLTSSHGDERRVPFLGQGNRGNAYQERLLLTVDSVPLYSGTDDRNLQEQPERVLQVPLPCGLVSEISEKSAGAGN